VGRRVKTGERRNTVTIDRGASAEGERLIRLERRALA
jgi:hypothetical protein